MPAGRKLLLYAQTRNREAAGTAAVDVPAEPHESFDGFMLAAVFEIAFGFIDLRDEVLGAHVVRRIGPRWVADYLSRFESQYTNGWP